MSPYVTDNFSVTFYIFMECESFHGDSFLCWTCFSCLVAEYDWLIDHVDGVRLRLWTAATSGPIVYPPGDIWAWRSMVRWWCRQRNTPDSSSVILPAESSGSKCEEWMKGVRNWACKHFFHTCMWFFTCRKIFPRKASDLIPIRRRVFCGFLSPLKSVASAGF
jgi:hypothetical protein